MSNNMNLEYAKSWFTSNHPEERLLRVYEYDNCYIFDSVPKGIEQKHGDIIRSSIGLDKETGKYFPYNPLKYYTSGEEVIHVIEDLEDHYATVGEEFVRGLNNRR